MTAYVIILMHHRCELLIAREQHNIKNAQLTKASHREAFAVIRRYRKVIMRFVILTVLCNILKSSFDINNIIYNDSSK